MKKKTALILCLAMLLSGCRTNGRQIDASYDATEYRDYMTEDNRVDSLNYLLTDKEKNLSLLGNLVDGLVEMDKYGNLKPAMAQDVGISSDQAKVWDFSIRGDVNWVDYQGNATGEVVTADDFLCGLQYVLDHRETSAYYDQIVSLIKNAKEYVEGKVSFDEVGIEAINAYTLRFTLTSSCSYFNTYLLNGGFYPVSRTLLAEVGDDFATAPDKMWYNGAYYLTKYEEDEILFKRNGQYWEVGQVSFDEGSIILVENNEEALKRFKSGKLSYAYIDADYVENHASDIDSHLYMSAISPESYVFLFNFESANTDFKKAVQNQDFRSAIFYGLNANAAFLTKETDKSDDSSESAVAPELDVSLQSTIIPNGFVTKTDGTDYVTLGSLANFSGKMNYDAQQSQNDMQKAMIALNQEVTFPIEIKVPVSDEHPELISELTRLFSSFDETFIQFTLVNYTTDETSDLPSAEEIFNQNAYDMVLVSLKAQNGDPSTYLKELTSTGKSNQQYSHFKDEVYDSLFAAANKFSDNDKRLMSFAECEAYLLGKAYVIPFSHGQLSYKVSSINDYSMPTGTYGLARYKLKGVKALEQAITISERAELQAAYEEAKKSAL